MTNTDTTSTASTTSDTRTAPTVTFFEVSGPDAPALRRFYADGLGLDVGPFEHDYATFASGDGAIPGGLWDGTATLGTYAVAYIEVDDLAAAVDRAEAAGATVVVPPTPHGPTRVAHIADPAGNRIGLYCWVTAPADAAG